MHQRGRARILTAALGGLIRDDGVLVRLDLAADVMGAALIHHPYPATDRFLLLHNSHVSSLPF
jgi:hypothetical protein